MSHYNLAVGGGQFDQKGARNIMFHTSPIPSGFWSMSQEWSISKGQMMAQIYAWFVAFPIMVE